MLDMAAVNGVTAAVNVAADVVDGAAVVKAAVDGAAAAEAMVVADVLDKAAVDGPPLWWMWLQTQWMGQQ